MAKSPTYRGYYLGIDKDGKVRRVYEYFDKGTVELSMMTDDAVSIPHSVMKGRQAKSEVVIVYGLRDIEFVGAAMEGGEYEKQTIAQIEAKAEK